MPNQNFRILPFVLVPALVTLGVTLLRLVGEVNGWSTTLFGSPEAGGGGGILGISWLIFVFGFWFGLRMQQQGAGPASRGKAFLMSVLGLAVLMGGMPLLQSLDVMWFPDKEHPGTARGIGWMIGLMATGCVVAAIGWGKAALTLLVYRVLARLPVIVVTWIALGQESWNTHYTKVPEFFLGVTEAERTSFLIMPQLTFWPGLTVLLGLLMANLGALVAGRSRN